MSASYTSTSTSASTQTVNENQIKDKNNDNNTNDNNNKDLYMTPPQYLYTYDKTKMILDLNNVTQFTNPLDPSNIFNKDTIFHYCNMIIDSYNNESVKLALYRDNKDYGPKNGPIDVYFHPFQWKSEWHLSIGFAGY
ncbi:hypothetical protein C6P40_002347, partial [Pichia californica]